MAKYAIINAEAVQNRTAAIPSDADRHAPYAWAPCHKSAGRNRLLGQGRFFFFMKGAGMTTDSEWDNILNIRTTGRDDSIADLVRFPYEPTDYCVLERLANSGYFTKRNTLLDYGCGKGRVEFFLAYQTKCQAIGIEYNERLFTRAKQNKQQAIAGGRVAFTLGDAADYIVPDEVDRVFFFNPFAVEILRKVMDHLAASYRQAPREILLFFYYPSAYYRTYLAAEARLTPVAAIPCGDLFKGTDGREEVLIYKFLD